jgi:phage baseplate assembly protein W
MARNYTYSDLDLNFNTHPIKQDINKFTDDVAVVSAVKNLVLMNKFESPFDPNLGSNVRRMLFENNTPTTEVALSEFISEVIRNYEPRVDLQSITLDFDESENGYNISIAFFIKAIPTRVFTGNFFLERTR